MRNTIKALLFSLLLFPGTGHFVLGKVRRGMIYFVPALAWMLYLMKIIMDQAEVLAEQMLSGANPQISETAAMSTISWMLAAIWLFAAIDAFYLGRQADKQATEKKPE